VRVLTYNVNYGLAGDADTLAAIVGTGADLILLQETTPAWERILRRALSAQYPHMTFHHRGGAGGQAMLSRLPVRAVEFYPPAGEGWFPAGRIVVETAFGPLQALNVHLRPPVSDGGSFLSGYFTTRRVRAQEIEVFFARLDPALPTLVAGDFNEEPDGRVTAFLTSKGMITALPRFAPRSQSVEPSKGSTPPTTGSGGQSPPSPTWTWRWDTGVGTLHKQLDHVVHDRRLEPRSVTVLDAGRSDHLPVLAVIGPAPAAAGNR
jgi:endonuclease/exonuclease/phosphatase family metal-dependent hydrolase